MSVKFVIVVNTRVFGGSLTLGGGFCPLLTKITKLGTNIV